MRRSCLCLSLSFLSIILVGTILVLSTVVAYFGVNQRDVITELEMKFYEHLAAQEKGEFEIIEQELASIVEPVEGNGLEGLRAGRGDSLKKREFNSIEKIPKIVHQTWKENHLPERWEKVRNECIALHPDYEYMLWSDETSLAFIEKEYPWFLKTFKGYPYPIQRADSIRYFVLHHFGGIYLDLDVGCKRSMDPLLYFDVILPATIPVGVSNDVMLAEKGHPFLDLVIHSLIAFDHQYTTNYPTVMFSTGPMFLSALYGMWPRVDGMQNEVRILPRRWYGKNAPIDEQGEAFFEHYYGSSWHSNDAGFITFLGKFGVLLLYAAVVIIIIGTIRLIVAKAPLAVPILKPALNLAPSLHFHQTKEALPFTRPGTPNSKSSSTFASPDVPILPRGFLSKVTAWFTNSKDLLPQHSDSRPSSPNQIFRFGELQQSNRYQPVPSRPPSPVPMSRDSSFDGARLLQASRMSPPPEAVSSLLSVPPSLPTPHRPPTIIRRRTSPAPSPPVSPKLEALNFYQPLPQLPLLSTPLEEEDLLSLNLNHQINQLNQSILPYLLQKKKVEEINDDHGHEKVGGADEKSAE